MVMNWALFNPFSAGSIFDVKSWHLKSIPAPKDYTRNIGIQMKRKELSEIDIYDDFNLLKTKKNILVYRF